LRKKGVMRKKRQRNERQDEKQGQKLRDIFPHWPSSF
jgi:hypothetical protein